MTAYPAIDELELRFRTGQGIPIIVEGNSDEDDPWFYRQWFDDRARQVTFFPQNGWSQVVKAVAGLRGRCPDMPVYGLIDRDFASDEALDADFATTGILRTPRYTLENYLLGPRCWAQVFGFIFRRRGGAPESWDDPSQVQGYIEQAYRDCLVLAAHNRVIKFGTDHYPAQAAQTPETERTYREHPDALADVDPAAKLCAWGQQLGTTEDLGDLFMQTLQALEQGGLSIWEQQVSGKYVLRELHRRFPRPDGGQFPLSHYLNLYLRECPDPPPDLVRLIERIIADAGHGTGDTNPFPSPGGKLLPRSNQPSSSR